MAKALAAGAQGRRNAGGRGLKTSAAALACPPYVEGAKCPKRKNKAGDQARALLTSSPPPLSVAPRLGQAVSRPIESNARTGVDCAPPPCGAKLAGGSVLA